MNTFNILDLLPILPELFLTAVVVFLLMLGAFKGNSFFFSLTRISIGFLAVAFMLVVKIPHDEQTILNGMFHFNGFIAFTKALILFAAALTLILVLGYFRKYQNNLRFEFPILVLLATIGMMLMVSSNNLIALYMGLELQSLCLYVLASINRKSERSSEAGLKYFVLGALASGLLLYGSSLIYGFTGSVDFNTITELYLDKETKLPIGVLVGLLLVIIAICFKISAVPFHMWTPDVYEGAPTPVTAFFAAAPKIAALVLFTRVLYEPFGNALIQWQQVILFVSMASMVVGALGALRQTNIKRLMAYSSIGHVGYALVGLSTGTESGISGLLIYLSIYMTMSLGAFACIIMLRSREDQFEEIKDLSGLAKTYPLRALALSIFMFSMAGIPPFAGFFGKYFIFLSAIESGLYGLAIVGVLSSVVAAYYYLRVVKVMYFDEPLQVMDKDIGGSLRFVAFGAALFNVFFFIIPAPLLTMAQAAVKSLFI